MRQLESVTAYMIAHLKWIIPASKHSNLFVDVYSLFSCNSEWISFTQTIYMRTAILCQHIYFLTIFICLVCFVLLFFPIFRCNKKFCVRKMPCDYDTRFLSFVFLRIEVFLALVRTYAHCALVLYWSSREFARHTASAHRRACVLCVGMCGVCVNYECFWPCIRLILSFAMEWGHVRYLQCRHASTVDTWKKRFFFFRLLLHKTFNEKKSSSTHTAIKRETAWKCIRRIEMCRRKDGALHDVVQQWNLARAGESEREREGKWVNVSRKYRKIIHRDTIRHGIQMSKNRPRTTDEIISSYNNAVRSFFFSIHERLFLFLFHSRFCHSHVFHYAWFKYIQHGVGVGVLNS